jgi:hypothetical protein
MNQAVFRQAGKWQIGVVFSRQLNAFGQFLAVGQRVNVISSLIGGGI